MKRKLIFAICLITLFAVNAIYEANADVEQRRAELFKVLDEELREVTRLNKQIGARRPDLILRMAQILLEKGRLLKDQENLKYLEIPAKEREKISSVDIYMESRRYFDQAQRTVLLLLKKFPRFEEKADAYYILAYNAKEIKEDDQSKKFFLKALQESKSDSIIADKSRIALAEIYFNKGLYDKSMSLYEAALRNKRDKWWTKDAFNLSWCYFKLGKYDKAIAIMSESYELSKQSRFIDMSKSIERDLAFFYTEAGRSDEAIAFYKKHGKSVSEIMLKVGRYLKSQGKYVAAEKTLIDGLQYKQSEKEEIEFNVELLSLFEKYGKDQKHIEACRALAIFFSKGVLNADQIEVLKFNAQKMSALIQQQLVNKTYDHQLEIRDNKASAAHEYFMISAILSPEHSPQDYFHAGETFFAITNYDRAIPLYAEAIKRAQKYKDTKTESLASTALMVSLGKDVKKSTVDQFLVPAYQSFLSSNPAGEKSSLIYQRLFSVFIEKKNYLDAEKVLVTYKTTMPAEFETQEKMLAQVMDHYKDIGDKVSLVNWVKRIDAKEFKVSPEYAAKIKTLVLGMQFEKVERASTKGDKKEALKGYLQIYKSPEMSQDAKKTAAYNISVLFYQQGDSTQLNLWANRAVSMMAPSEIVKFEKDLIIFSTDLFQRRLLSDSAALSERVFDKICSTESKNKRVFLKNANVIYLAEKQFESSKRILAKAGKCGVGTDVILAGYLDHLNELSASSKWNSFSEIIAFLEQSKEMIPQLIYPSSLLANELEGIGRSDEAAKIKHKMMSYYATSKKNKLDVPTEGLDAISSIRLTVVEENLKKLNSMKLSFPEPEYNRILKAKFAILDGITTDVVSISEMASGAGIIKAYRLLVQAHEDVKNEVLSFVLPAEKTPDYVSSFKKSMAKLVEPLFEQAEDFRQTAVKKIEKENILSTDNSWFLTKNRKIFIPEYFSETVSVSMDKVGSK